jgi:dihydrofolate synthase/folylpolyglutamate synthase
MYQRFPDLIRPFLYLLVGKPLIKVTGTNGKGSLCAMIEACLASDGTRTGLFTSPHLSRVAERFRVAGTEVSVDTIDRHAEEVLRIAREEVDARGESYRPSFFECLILIAMHIFHEQQVDVAVFEAGVGGYNDATSFLPGQLSVITSVGMDHKAQLGDSLEAIAADKAGIASPGGHLVIGPEVAPPLRTIIEEDARLRRVEVSQATLDGLSPSWLGLHHPTVITMSMNDQPTVYNLPLLGRHQVSNFATLVTVMQALERQGIIRNLESLKGVENTRWSGRLEVRNGNPCYVIDAAHNEHGVLALINSLTDLVPYAERVLLYGTSAEKDYRAYLGRLSQLAPQVFLVDGFHRAEQTSVVAEALSSDFQCSGTFSTPRQAVEFFSTEPAYHDRVIVAMGSIFMIGELIDCLDSLGLQKTR